MRMTSKTTGILLASAMFAAPMGATASAQELPSQRAQQQQAAASSTDNEINVYGQIPTDLSGLEAGPKIEGILAARTGNRLIVNATNNSEAEVSLSEATRVTGSGGFLGLGRTELASSDLLPGLPVEIETVNYAGGLIASRVKYKTSDYETAEMIRGGTQRQFAMHGQQLAEHDEAIDGLRSRVANIDQYNIRHTANVYFDSGKWRLTPAAQNELCATASQAEQIDNALLLVVGYTDTDGSQEFNQTLSERRAGGVVNYLQQACGWAPYRMLTPTGMAEADPAADNTTPAGKAQNRRVAVNVLVSKAVDDGQEVAYR
ncbi:OmpA family protein [Aurantiacibacter xanthus]|uniref:OmpA family protein n=2 Tax=Aurantiacibacter xanthus TaxID=1784712 RepID=A0A3A1PCC6_9SPHN|nr:OmpA family protein [Aurantiacibacter xanthus]